MQLLGSVILAGCCLLLGFLASEGVREHRRRLETAELFWKGVRAELLTRRSPPEELFRQRMENSEFVRYLDFLPRVVDQLARGVPFPMAFAAGMEEQGAWKGEELVCQRRLGGVLGQLPLQEQLDALGLLADTLGGLRMAVQEEEQRQCRFYRSMGAAAGAAIVILLL